MTCHQTNRRTNSPYDQDGLTPKFPKGSFIRLARLLISCLAMLCTCVTIVNTLPHTSRPLSGSTHHPAISHTPTTPRSSVPFLLHFRLYTSVLESLVAGAPHSHSLVPHVLPRYPALSFSFYSSLSIVLFSNLPFYFSRFLFPDLTMTQPCNGFVISWARFVLMTRKRPSRP